MKLFSESTNIMKESKRKSSVDPNYKGEDLPFLIAEAVRTSMEVDGFVHKVNTEADTFVMETAESKGIDLESDSEERTSLIMEAAFGEGQDKGVIQKVIDFIKKMYRKVADFIKGIIGRFQNVQKLLDKTISEYTVLGNILGGKEVPSDAEIKVKETEAIEAAEISVKLFDINTLFDMPVEKVTYTGLGATVTNLSSIQKFKSEVQTMNNALGGTNNEASQHKLLTKYVKHIAKGLIVFKDDELNESSTDKDPKKALMDKTYLSETKTLKNNEIKEMFGEFTDGLFDELDTAKVRNLLDDGKTKFEEKADEFDKNASKLEKALDKAKGQSQGGPSSSAVTDLTAALNNYSSVVGIYTSVSTTVYTFAVKYIQEYLNRAKKFASDLKKVVDKEGKEID